MYRSALTKTRNCVRLSSVVKGSNGAKVTSQALRVASICNVSNLLNTSSSKSKRYNLSITKSNAKYFSSGELPEHTKVTLPALSPTMELGTIVSWEKKEGDKLNEGDLLAEIETDKATMGFETPEEGYLAKILIQAGTKDIPIGKLLCIIVSEESEIAAFANYVPTEEDLKSAASAPEKQSPQPQQSKPVAPPPQTIAPSAQMSPIPSSISSSGISGRIFASPLAKKLASDKGIELSQLTGSGPNGRIRAQDVLNAPAGGQSRTAYASSSTSYKDIDVTNIRQVIAKRLLMSKQTIPHYYLTTEIEVDDLLKARQQVNEMVKGDNAKISVNDFIIKAAALACMKVPEVNSAWYDTYVRQYNSVDVSVAVSTDNGLITPIVFGAEKKGLLEISTEIKSLAKKARDGKLQPQEFQGGTFTISNLGMFGVSNFSAVINPPQSCILAVGGTEKKLIPDENGMPKASSIMTVTLSCDHRVVDGAVGATWLKNFKQFVSNPFSMIL